MSSEEKTKIAKLPWTCVGLAFLTLVVGIYWTVFVEYDKGVDSAGRAELGDFWGGHLGAVTAFAASLLFLAGLLFQSRELSLQRKELMLQRNELRLTRDEMRRSSESQKVQAEMLEKSAKLSSLGKLHDHYRSQEANSVGSPRRNAIVIGTNRWATRQMHRLVEGNKSIRETRSSDIGKEINFLLRNIDNFMTRLSEKGKESTYQYIASKGVGFLKNIGICVGSLMYEESISGHSFRNSLFDLHEVLWNSDNSAELRLFLFTIEVKHLDEADMYEKWAEILLKKLNRSRDAGRGFE